MRIIGNTNLYNNKVLQSVVCILLSITMTYMIVNHIKLLLIIISLIFIVVALFYYPLVGIFFCVICDLLLNGMRIFSANPRSWIILLLFGTISISNVVYQKVKLNESTKSIIKYTVTPVLLILVYHFFLNFIIYQDSSLSENIRMPITVLACILLFVAIQLLVKSEKQLKWLSYWTICIGMISAVFAILQFGLQEPFDVLRTYLGKEDLNTFVYLYSDDVARPPGLSLTKIFFSYEMLPIVFLLIGFLLSQKKNAPLIEMIFLSISSFIIISSVFINFTRSCILGILCGILAILFRDKKLNKSAYIFIFVAVLVVVLANLSLQPSDLNKYKSLVVGKDASAQGRFYRGVLNLRIGINTIWGVGNSENARRIGKNYVAALLTKGGQGFSYDSFSAHNYFIKIFLLYGFIGFLLFIIFLYRIIVLSLKFRRVNHSSLFLQALSYSFLPFIIAYCVHSFFHNYGPIGSDTFFWYVLSIYIAGYRLVMQSTR